MRTQEIEAALAAGYPVDRERVGRLDLEAMEADLLVDVETVATVREPDGGAPAVSTPVAGEPAGGGARRRIPRRLALGVGALGVAVVAAIVLLVPGGSGSRPRSAYGAELVRFAETSPLLLLRGGWGVRSVEEPNGGEGRMEITRPSPTPHPDEPLMTRGDVKRHVTPRPVIERRLRRIELNWHDAGRSRLLWRGGKVGRAEYDAYLHKTVDFYESGPAFKTTIPSLGVTAYIAPRTESAPIQGGPGDRLMVALWIEGHHLIELRASVPDLAAFRERLDLLWRVDARTWLDAMPARVVKAAEYGAATRHILAGIPQPPGFDPVSIPDLGLTTDRYQVGAAVGGAVACAWFDRWGEARAEGDPAGAREAERVLLESDSRWPIFRQMSKEGAYPATVLEYARKMRSGRWYGRPLLRAVDSKGGLCGPETAAGG